ncbi:Phosphoglycolate phosphatase [Candidatus Entotheonellaceae bacterium PAL068K]
MQLVLFDIDGTLLTTGLAGADAMQSAFVELYQVDDGFAGIKMAGQTDPLILQEALANHRLPHNDDTLEVFQERYVGHLRRTLKESHRPRRLMPGIPALLEALSAQSDVLLGLLTGNLALSAQLKLESFGIWHYFRVGAYGSDAPERNALVPVARQRARALLERDIPPERIIVIGDTPRDIACARGHGARAVAVATGNYSLAELQQHRPDHCFADLGNVSAVLRVFNPST